MLGLRKITYSTFEAYQIACKKFVKQGVFVAGHQDPKHKIYEVIVKEK